MTPYSSCYDQCGTFVKFHHTSLPSDRVFERGGPKKATYKHLFFPPLPPYPSKELDSVMDVTAALFPNMVSFRGFNRFITSRCSVTQNIYQGEIFLVCFLVMIKKNNNKKKTQGVKPVSGFTDSYCSIVFDVTTATQWLCSPLCSQPPNKHLSVQHTELTDKTGTMHKRKKNQIVSLIERH